MSAAVEARQDSREVVDGEEHEHGSETKHAAGLDKDHDVKGTGHELGRVESGTLVGFAKEDLIKDDALDAQYVAKARVLNGAMQEIGMGKYHWFLFVVTGFGWFADNLWPIVTGLIVVPIQYEFKHPAPFLKLGQNLGLLVGAVVWSFASDVWGRRWAFNLTLLVVGVFGTAAGASPNFTALCSLAAAWSVGVGGNLPVDSAIFVEFVPGSHQYLLTVLSVWWAFGQLIGSLVAWPLIGNMTCTPGPAPELACPKDQNMGWRYFLYTMGGLMLFLFAIRFFVFKLYESPKYFMSRGRDEDAVAVIHAVADYNGKTSSLRIEDLTRYGHSRNLDASDPTDDSVRSAETGSLSGQAPGIQPATAAPHYTSRTAAVKRILTKYDTDHIKSLFRTRKMAWNTSLMIVIWALIGLAFPLFNAFVTYFLQSRGADFGDGSTYITYRNQVILSVVGVPGSIIGGFLVEIPYLGRRGTLSISTVLTGVFLMVSTTARSSDALLGWTCGYSFWSNLMYGVLYAFTTEIFPTKDRGTGNGLCASANRVFGVISPIIALYGDLTTSVPIWISGALFIAAGLLALLLPYEPQGHNSM